MRGRQSRRWARGRREGPVRVRLPRALDHGPDRQAASFLGSLHRPAMIRAGSCTALTSRLYSDGGLESRPLRAGSVARPFFISITPTCCGQ